MKTRRHLLNWARHPISTLLWYCGYVERLEVQVNLLRIAGDVKTSSKAKIEDALVEEARIMEEG